MPAPPRSGPPGSHVGRSGPLPALPRATPTATPKSAYLPTRLTAAHVADGRLFPVADAPEFTRNVYLVLSERATTWSWLAPTINALTTT